MSQTEEAPAFDRNDFQIGRLDTKGKILDLTDPSPYPQMVNLKAVKSKQTDEEGRRIRVPVYEFNYCNYGKEGEALTHRHWIDADKLGVLAFDFLNLACGIQGTQKSNLEFRPLLEEHKGGTENGQLVARTLEVSYQDHICIKNDWQPRRSGPVYRFLFRKAEGEKGDKGQISPKRGGKVLLAGESFDIPVDFVRPFAMRVQRYLQAKEAAAIVMAQGLGPVWEQLSELNDRLARNTS